MTIAEIEEVVTAIERDRTLREWPAHIRELVDALILRQREFNTELLQGLEDEDNGRIW